MKEGFDALEIGKAETLRTGTDIALLAIGEMVAPAQQAAEALAHEGIECEVVNMRFIKPLDTALLDEIGSRFHHVITIENNSVIGGFGGAVCEYFARGKNNDVRVTVHGIPDRFVDHGSPAELLQNLTDGTGIAASPFRLLSSPISRYHDKSDRCRR